MYVIAFIWQHFAHLRGPKNSPLYLTNSPPLALKMPCNFLQNYSAKLCVIHYVCHKLFNTSCLFLKVLLSIYSTDNNRVLCILVYVHLYRCVTNLKINSILSGFRWGDLGCYFILSTKHSRGELWSCQKVE